MNLISRLSRQIAILSELPPNAIDSRFAEWKEKTLEVLSQAAPNSDFLREFKCLGFVPLPRQVKRGEQFPDSADEGRPRFEEDRAKAERLLRSVIDELDHRSSSRG